jgi:RNA polymerase sigma factor (TIGR02999 family)
MREIPGATPFARAGADDVYARLRRLAGLYLARERNGHTLQPTALVHEAYLRMGDEGVADLDDAAVIGRAARVMRQVLVDHARRKRASKRSADGERLPLDETLASVERSVVDIIALHEALTRLAELDERMASVVELRFFAGLSAEEAAAVLGISKASADRAWRVARLWLYDALAGERRDAS